MAQQQAKCVNYECGQVNKVVTVNDGEKLTCVECGKDLKLVTGKKVGNGSTGGGGNSAKVIVPVAALLVLLLLFSAWKVRLGCNMINPPLSGDVGMFYERSGKSWLEPAAEAFGKTHDGAKIIPTPIGSYEGKQKILEANDKTNLPVIWNPGESYWIGKLASDWEKASQHKGNANVIGTRYDILYTHYVFVMWEDRARVFELAMQKPEYQNRTWHLLYTIATRGWSAIGGQASWGTLKLVHSNPMKSSSGLLSLGLILAEYRREGHPSAETNDSGYMNLMQGIEKSVVSAPDTTSLTTKAFTEGGSEKVDMIVAYEQNALELIKNGQQRVRIIYPEPGLNIKFPAVVLKTSWVTDKQAKVGEDFIKYLLSREVQEKAVDSGFYPVLTELRETENQKLDIPLYKQSGFRLRPDSKDLQALRISQRDLEGVQYTWNEWLGHPKN